MEDAYLTIGSEASHEIKVKGSRFIGQTYAVTTSDAALSKLAEIRKRYWDATHNCFAYIVGAPPEPVQFKYSDDGEPSGTAGKPIYDVLSGSGVVNVLLVVTRYFGGTKLGTGGLVKAYGEAAKLALDDSGAREVLITDPLTVVLDFSLYDPLQKLIHTVGAIQVDAEFTDHVRVKLEIRKSLTERLIAQITELSSGKALIERQG